jgi:hypothetical protein
MANHGGAARVTLRIVVGWTPVGSRADLRKRGKS